MNDERNIMDEETDEEVITEIEKVMEANRRKQEAEYVAVERTVADQDRDNAKDLDVMVKAVNAKKKSVAAQAMERQAAAREAVIKDEGLYVNMLATKPVTIRVEDPEQKPEKKFISMDYLTGFLTSAAICLLAFLVISGVL